MRITLARLRGSLCIAAATGAVLLMLGMPAHAQASGSSGTQFVGTWIHNVAGGPALVTIHSDGTLMVSSSFMFGRPGWPVRFSPIHAVWEKTGPKSIAITSIFFVFDADGMMTAYQRNRCFLRLGHDRDSYTGVEFMETLPCEAGSCPDPLDPTAQWIPSDTMPETGYPSSGARLKVVRVR
jgi:hypothetical protein